MVLLVRNTKREMMQESLDGAIWWSASIFPIQFFSMLNGLVNKPWVLNFTPVFMMPIKLSSLRGERKFMGCIFIAEKWLNTLLG